MQCEKLDYLQHINLEPCCSASSCDRTAINTFKGRGYCNNHAREIRDKVYSRLHEDRAEESKSVYVYAMSAPELSLFKIGKSLNPKKRHLTLQTCSPVVIKLLGFVLDPAKGKMESWIHAYLHEDQHRGEWFRSTESVRKIVYLIAKNRISELLIKFPPPLKREY